MRACVCGAARKSLNIQLVVSSPVDPCCGLGMWIFTRKVWRRWICSRCWRTWGIRVNGKCHYSKEARGECVWVRVWLCERRPCRHEPHSGQVSAAHHPVHNVHFRGGGERHRHRGPADFAQGAKGDDFLHSGVWSGRDGPPGHPAGKSRHHRNLHEGLVAGGRAAVPVLRLHPDLLLLGAAQHRVRDVNGAIPGDKPRVLLQRVREPETRRAHSSGHLHLQRCVLRAAQPGLRTGEAAELQDVVFHRLAEQPDHGGHV